MDTPVIVTPSGQPARKQSDLCPRCGEGKDKRVLSGFGVAYEICLCGYEFKESA